MTGSSDALRDFIAAWNARDHEESRALIERSLTETATYSDSMGDSRNKMLQGWAAIAEFIRAWQEAHPSQTIELVDRPDDGGDELSFTWSYGRDDGRHEPGTGIAERIPDGRLDWVALVPGKRRTAFIAPILKLAKENTLPFFSVLAGLIFGVVYVPLTLFYRQFGVTPREVGFADYTIVWSILAAAAVLMLFGVVLAVGLLAFSLPVDLNIGIRNRLPGWRTPVILIGDFFPIAAIFVIIYIAGFHSWPPLIAIFFGFWWLAVATALVLAITVLVTHWPEAARRVRHQEVRRLAVEFRRRYLSYLLAAPLLLLVAATVGLPAAALDDAYAVQADGRVPADLLPWRAQPVTVTWKVSPGPVSLPDCGSLRYLGENAGEFVILDWKKQITYRLSSADVVLAFPNCPTNATPETAPSASPS
jgi:hypothetical protein